MNFVIFVVKVEYINVQVVIIYGSNIFENIFLKITFLWHITQYIIHYYKVVYVRI